MDSSLETSPAPSTATPAPRRVMPALAFLATLLALGAVAAYSLFATRPLAEGLPPDPAVAAAREAVAGATLLGFGGLRFRSALLGEADPDRLLPRIEARSAARAESLLVAATLRRPLDPRLHAALGSLALARRRWPEAEQTFRLASEGRTPCPEARLGLGIALCQRALTESDRLRARGLELRAIAQFAAVPPRAQVYPEALYDRALVLARVGRGTEAKRRAAEYRALDPGSHWAARLEAETAADR